MLKLKSDGNNTIAACAKFDRANDKDSRKSMLRFIGKYMLWLNGKHEKIYCCVINVSFIIAKIGTEKVRFIKVIS